MALVSFLIIFSNAQAGVQQPDDSAVSSSPVGFWQQTLGNGLDFAIKDLEIRAKNSGDTFYAGELVGYLTPDYATDYPGYNVPPIERYSFYNFGSSTPTGFDGKVTLTAPINYSHSLSSFPLNPNRYYKFSINGGDSSRTFQVYGSASDTYPNGKAYYSSSYHPYPCASPLLNPEETCEPGTNNGIADIFFQFGMAETLVGKETRVTDDITRQEGAVIDGDLIAWMDISSPLRDIYVYEISTGRKIRITNDNSIKNDFFLAGRKILWTVYDISNQKSIFIHDLDTNITTDITTEFTGEIGVRAISISDFDGQRIAWQTDYEGSYPSIYLYDLATSQSTLIDRSAFVNYTSQIVSNPKISGAKVLYKWFWNCGTWCGQEELRLYDIATGEKTKIFNNYGFSSDYATDGNNIVIVVYGQPSLIYRYKISTGEMTQISSSFRQTIGIDISGDVVVWSDQYDIFIYDLATGKAGRAGMAPRESFRPKVSGNTVVWDDYRDVMNETNIDIYMYQIATSTNQSPTLSFVEGSPDGLSENDGIQDKKGTADKTLFDFHVVYTNKDNDPPSFVKLVVEKVIQGAHEGYLNLEMSRFCPLCRQDYASGQIYIVAANDLEKSLTFPKGNYRYQFEANDGVSIVQTPFTEFTVGYPNVAFLPGIKGSKLYENPVCELCSGQLWVPPGAVEGDWKAQKLILNQDGTSLNKGIYTKDILKEAYGFNIYLDFSASMEKFVSSGAIKAWKPLPYDWRLDFRHIVQSGIVDDDKINYSGETTATPYILEEIKKLISSSDNGKVAIVAHSQGGLIAKTLLKQLEDENHPYHYLLKGIDKLILVASPQLGTPRAIAGLLHGDLESIAGGIFLTQTTARTLAENMPSAYNLLPSEKYFEKVDTETQPLLDFDSSLAGTNLEYIAGTAITNAEDLYRFLTDDKNRTKPSTDDITKPNILNKYLLSAATTTHNTFLDEWKAPKNIEVVQIAGWGLDTVRGMRYFVSECGPATIAAYEYCRELLMTSEGDEAVVYPSALATSDAPSKYYFDLKEFNSWGEGNWNSSHAYLFETQPIQELVQQIVQNKVDEDNLPRYVTVEKPVEHQPRFRLAVKSPVSIDIYDSFGRHTGLSPNQKNQSPDFVLIDQQIPNSYYYEIDGHKHLGLDSIGSHSIILRGLDLGTFTFELDKVLNDQTIGQNVFATIPVTAKTIGTLAIDEDAIKSLRLDIDGDSVIDITLAPGEAVNPAASLEVLIKVIASLDVPKGIEQGAVSKIDAALGTLKRGNAKAASNQMDALVHYIDAQAGKHIPLDRAVGLTRIVEEIKGKMVP